MQEKNQWEKARKAIEEKKAAGEGQQEKMEIEPTGSLVENNATTKRKADDEGEGHVDKMDVGE